MVARSIMRIGESLAAKATGFSTFDGSAQTESAMMLTASFSPLRSKMTPPFGLQLDGPRMLSLGQRLQGVAGQYLELHSPGNQSDKEDDKEEQQTPQPNLQPFFRIFALRERFHYFMEITCSLSGYVIWR
ncbi:MAG: hypothetical protein CSYNP_04515 [Syntrophus sp. SKADARSKE-3]|nr:hypothetical protein [Syntrophus sp. SKADARSKE-3]